MIKKTLFFSGLFVFSLFCFLVATAPANLIWKEVLEPKIKNRVFGLNVSSVQGTIWDGKAQLSYQKFPFVLDWDISLLGLFSLQLPIYMDIHSQAGDIKLLAKPGIGRSLLTLTTASIDLSQLTPLVKRRRVVLDGQLNAKDLELVYQDQKITSLTGSSSWSGGDISYPAGRDVHERNLPAFKASAVTNEQGTVNISVRDAGAAFDVITVTLDSEGEAILKVARRLLDISSEAWPSNSKETDIVFKVKKVIY